MFDELPSLPHDQGNLAAPVLVVQHQGAATPQLCPVEAVHPID